MKILLGAVADDFTGATDLANTLVKQGMKTVQVLGVPDENTDIGDADAVVVALKSRTAPIDQAVTQSLQSLEWLRARGAQQFLSKYCSTFDSTDAGNIGPIADAMMAALQTDFALVCPAFPETGRTIFKGHLFVGDTPLAESPMKDHPLTPMRDSSLVRLMNAQSGHAVGLIEHSHVRTSVAKVRDRVDALKAQGCRYGVIDVIEDADLMTIGAAIHDHVLITGGSGIALGLPQNFRDRALLGSQSAPEIPSVDGRQLALAGSCSEATRKQIAAVQDRWPTRKLEMDRIAVGDGLVDEIADWACSQPEDQPILIYASADPNEVAANQSKYGKHRAGEMIEACFGDLAQRMVDAGFTRLVTAGGETSGAAVSALGIRAIRIGPQIAPGVPWTEALGGTPLALAMKSGNFGGENFFEDAFQMLD